MDWDSIIVTVTIFCFILAARKALREKMLPGYPEDDQEQSVCHRLFAISFHHLTLPVLLAIVIVQLDIQFFIFESTITIIMLIQFLMLVFVGFMILFVRKKGNGRSLVDEFSRFFRRNKE